MGHRVVGGGLFLLLGLAVGACSSGSGSADLVGGSGRGHTGSGGDASPLPGAGGAGGSIGIGGRLGGRGGSQSVGAGGRGQAGIPGGSLGGSPGAFGGTSGASGGAGGTVTPAGRRLPLPCTAPLPTGYCLKSDPGDYIGAGRSYSVGGAASVKLQGNSTSSIELALTDGASGTEWTLDLVAPAGSILVPGLYDPAQRYPFQMGSAAGLDVSGNGAGCNMLTGKFSVEELARSPATGVTRFSATFEQHCEGATAALRGVVNFEATGSLSPTLAPDRMIPLTGKVSRIAYDPAAHVGYGLDAANRRLAKIDMANGTVTYADVVQVPNDGCVDTKRGRLFVVNKGSSLITEYATANLTAVRDIAWAGTDWGPSDTHFKIYCGPDRVYVVDGAWAPGLFTVEGIDGTAPTVVDHTAAVSGVGGLALGSAGANIYYWYQYGWSAGVLNTHVSRLLSSDLSQIDVSASDLSEFTRDPLDAPILLDEIHGRVFVKNKVFDSMNLTKLIFTLPSKFDTFDGAAENAYALDAAHGFLATKSYVYELGRYEIVMPTVIDAADQLFFDASGMLWFLSVSRGALFGQTVTP
jgi:hypothetical protein